MRRSELVRDRPAVPEAAEMRPPSGGRAPRARTDCAPSSRSAGPHGDPKAPRSEPRRDRRADLLHLRPARDRDCGRGARPDDAGAFHTRRAAEVEEVPGYLDIEGHRPLRRGAGADAVHPGYGFLAENAASPRRSPRRAPVRRPVPDAIRAAGDKLEAKRLAAEAGVPVVPSGDPTRSASPSW